MKIISHRGNIDGPCDLENRSSQIDTALNLNFDVEIDIWKVEDQLYLGHDKPEEKVELDFLLSRSKSLWIHCKNLAALRYLKEFRKLNIFWHQTDDFVLTKSGHIWTYPGKELSEDSVAVVVSKEMMIPKNKIFGVCTDFPRKYLSLFDGK